MIFISHTHTDKPVVEPIAIQLSEIFGEEKVFYDSWSIQPGDGIIQKMNEGLADPKFVFFFVSEASLNSKMVELEWQNALWKATKGDCKIIPVRVDGSAMPPLMRQTLYIDLHTNGVEVAKQQIVGLIQGTKGFEPAHSDFSNLTWTAEGDVKTTLKVMVSASHLLEPNPFFLLIFDNDKSQISVRLKNRAPSIGGYSPDVQLNNGEKFNGWAIAPMTGAITPKHPLEIEIEAKGEEPVRLKGVMHKSSGDGYFSIPNAAQ